MGRPRKASRKSFPPHVYENAAGYFTWRDPSTGKSFGLGRDKAYAFTEARAANAKRAAEESQSLIQRIEPSLLLSAWVEEWISGQIGKRAEKTIKSYRTCTREILARCGHIPVNQIKPRAVVEVLEHYSNAGHSRSAEMIRSVLSDLFRAAEAKGYIEVGTNPVTATETEKSKVKRERLSLDDFMAIHRAERKSWAKAAMELALVTAQRRGDVAAMRRSDIVDGHLQVDQRKSGGKTKIGIPLSLRLNVVGWSLEEVIARCRTAGLITPYLVHHRRKGGHYAAGDPLVPDRLSEAFAESRVRAKLTTEEGRTPPTFHEIRSLAIRLYTEQAGKEFAQALAGHKSEKTTLLYTDPRDSEVQRLMISF